jgi:hypothetical protein
MGSYRNWSTTSVCMTCSAVVEMGDQPAHDNWHSMLDSRDMTLTTKLDIETALVKKIAISLRELLGTEGLSLRDLIGHDDYVQIFGEVYP